MDEHCKDCCCAQSWKALDIHEYTGKSIPEHISILSAENAALKTALAEAEKQAEEAEEKLSGVCNMEAITSDAIAQAEAAKSRLRDAEMEKAVMVGIIEKVKPFITHKTDRTDLEVCYDWCPACAINSLPARASAYNEVIEAARIIAGQKKVEELESDGDFEYGYDMLITLARDAIRKLDGEVV